MLLPLGALPAADDRVMQLGVRCLIVPSSVKNGLNLREWGSLMKCLVCAGIASGPTCEGPWEERDCPACGRYRVADALILTLMEQGQIFDVEMTRKWLAQQRRDHPVPCIEPHNVWLAE